MSKNKKSMPTTAKKFFSAGWLLSICVVYISML